MEKVLDENDIRYISEFQEYLDIVKESIKDTDKAKQSDTERIQKQRDAWYSVTSISNEATCFLDHAESLLELLKTTFFEKATPDDLTQTWDIDHTYKIIQDTLYAISWKIARANAMLHAGMGTEHGYLQGMKISVKEMDDTIKRVNALKDIR